LVDSPARFAIAHLEVADAQLRAANDRLQERRGQIGLLANRAETAGIETVESLEDLVPLLFAHTTYKSYPESWLLSHKWDRLSRWLETVSTYPVTRKDFSGIEDIDDWLLRLQGDGHYVSCSSGTTGKCSIIAASDADRAFTKVNTAQAFAWGTGIEPNRDFKVMATVPVPLSPRNRDTRAAISEAFGGGDDYEFPDMNMTIGQVSRMVALRRAIAEGTALPEDITTFEETSRHRQEALDAGVRQTAEALIASRGRKLLLSGQFALLYQATELVRAQGYGREDFDSRNALFIGGGLKGATLPPDFFEVILDTYNLSFERVYQYYGMQEINTTMPRCPAKRYHIPPWLIVLVLDQHGEALTPMSGGEAEGRAGFFDLSLDGRWGGIISGDKVHVRYGKCDCGHEGPTVGYNIVRYADLGDGDKITCAGTIEAYVRGVS
jgi:hypothetical protein